MVVKIKQKSDGFAILFFISAQNSPRLPRLPKRFLQVFFVFVLLRFYATLTTPYRESFLAVHQY